MKKTHAKPTAERVRELLIYDHQTGVFTRRIDVVVGFGRVHKAGTAVGCVDKDSGYVVLSIDGKRHRAHRIAWLYVHGEWPAHDVDHRDTIRDHNWIENLWPVTRQVNLQNKRRANKTSQSGVLGVCWDSARGKWRADISVDDKNVYIGRFEDLEDARSAYVEAKRRVHPGCTL